MTMTDKLTPNTMKNQYDHQYNVFCRKNHDYGNSFEKSLDTFGLVAGIIRMNDKFERLVSLNDPNKDAQIASESLVDTLEDLSNYAAMAACWLKGRNAVYEFPDGIDTIASYLQQLSKEEAKKENDWWTSHDRTWVFNARTRELFRIPNFQFPGRKELEERDAGSIQ